MPRRIRTKKSADSAEVELGKAISMAVRSGKTALGAQNALKDSRMGKAIAFIITENTPPDIVSELEYNLKFYPKIALIRYQLSALQLGATIGRPHRVSVMTIYDAGDSKLLELIPPA